MGKRGALSGFSVFIGGIMVLAFAAVTLGLVWPVVRDGGEPSQVAAYMLGNLTGMALTVVAHQFGSSQGSRDKDAPKDPGDSGGEVAS